MSGIPPLRITNTDGTFNHIPVFELELSGGVLTKLSPTKVQLAIAGAMGPSGPSGTITIGSGIGGAASAGYVLYVSGATLGQINSGWFVDSSRTISTVYPISGGGNLGVNRSFAIDTAFLVNSGRIISTTYPLSGGGNLSADRTFFILTGALGQILTTSGGVTGDIAWVNSSAGSSVVYAATGNAYIVTDLAGDLTGEFRLVQSGNSITVTTAAGLITINATTGDLSGKQNTITYPLGINSGGTGLSSVLSATNLIGFSSSDITKLDSYRLAASDNMTIIRVGTAYLFSATTGAGGSGSGASTANTYVVTDFSTDLSSEFRLVQSGNSITINTAGNLIIINAVTNAAAGGGTKTEFFPMSLLAVNPRNSNAWYEIKTGANIEAAQVVFTDNAVGVATFYRKLPPSLLGTGSWNLIFDHDAATNSGGDVTLTFRAFVNSNGSTIDSVPVVLSATNAYAMNSTNILNVSTATATNYDAILPLSAGTIVRVVVERSGNDATDTITSNWNLKSLSIKADINT